MSKRFVIVGAHTIKDLMNDEYLQIKQGCDLLNQQDQRIAELEEQLENCVLPVKIGDKVYKICPKCSDKHNGSCKNCAWGGCLGPCFVGVCVYEDGSFNENPLQLVEKVVSDMSISVIYDWWNIMFFDNEDEANQALNEYDRIRKIESRSERVERFNEWYMGRKIKNPLRR